MKENSLGKRYKEEVRNDEKYTDDRRRQKNGPHRLQIFKGP